MELLQEYVAQIHHNCRQGYFMAMQKSVSAGMEKFPNEPTLKFYFGISLLFQKKTAEALRQLSPLHSTTPVTLGALLASTVGHRAYADIDQEELASIESRIKEERRHAKPEELYYAGVFLALSGKPEKAKEYLDRALKQNSGLQDLITLRGWVELSLSDENNPKARKALEYFEIALKSNRKHTDAILGTVAFYEQSRQFDAGIEKCNALLAFYSNWIPVLEEKMKLVLCIQDWDQALDLANRILALNRANLEATRFKILYSLCREGDVDSVVKSLDKFFALCKEQEPNNGKYFVENARMFSQLGSYSPEILAQSLKFARFATDLELDRAEYVADVGRIYLLMEKVKEANQEFRAATTMDNTSPSASYGLIACQLAEGKIQSAFEQLEFLRESAGTSKLPSEHYYLAAVVAKKQNKPAEAILTQLNNAKDSYFRELKNFPYNMTYIKSFNPDFVLKIVREFLLFAPQEPVSIGMQAPAAVRQATMILETILKICPSHSDALFISAQTKYLSGDWTSATFILNQILKIDPNLMEGYLLMTQIQLTKNEFKEAAQTLELGLSCNFKVREHPKYHFLLGRVEHGLGEDMKALNSFKDGLNLVKASKVTMGKEEDASKFEFGQQEMLNLYMDYVTVLRALKKTDEANRVLEEAYQEFKDTHLDGRIALIQAEELVNNGKVDEAIQFLQQIKREQNHFVESRKLLADILLEYKNDKQTYTQCFTDIVELNSTPANLVLLGDAYMTVQEHERAVEAYDLALTKSPKDAALASKMGQALVSTHQYQKAINYYKEAIKSEDNFHMRIDLASLYTKLQQWDKAEKTLQLALGDLRDTSLNGIIMEAKLLYMLGRVQQGAGNSHQAQQSLIKAKESQSRVLKRTILEQPSYLAKQKQQFASICKQLGEIVEKPNDIEFAIRNLKEALNLCPGDIVLLTTLSKLYLKVVDHVNCQIYCEQLLQVKPHSVDANFMLGELYFRHNHDFAKSAQYFQQILDHKPTHFDSLSWYIECARRCGRLNDAEPLIKKASDRCDPDHPGLCYCSGLFEWYNGNGNPAVKKFQYARKDAIYGQKATLLMIDVYMSRALGESGEGGDSKYANDGYESKESNLNTVETLLWDLTSKAAEDKFRRQVLDCIALIATRNKNKIEKALQELTGLNLTEPGRDSVMLAYALAKGYMFLKQTPRARNQLKRMARVIWTFEEAEYCEGCWLMLADIYIQGSKYDLATEMIKRVLQYNKGCAKASEYLGFIMEKEQAYADAAHNYEQAWKLGNYANAELGFKLGFNYLKAKRYPDAIDVCHIVLSKSPNYPKIRKEILEKARANLRP